MKRLSLMGMLLMPMFAMAQTVALPAGVVKPAFFDKQGIKVLAHQKGAGGLNVWTVERGPTKTVLYTTPDNKVLLSGVLWDASSGVNLSDTFISDDMRVAPGDRPALASPAPVAQEPSFVAKVAQVFSPSKISAPIKGVATLKGIKEGRAPDDKTLYIFFDPRCPYCASVYRKTRDYVKKGGTIKWVPVVILGDRVNGSSLIADTLQASNPPAVLGSVMGSRGSGSTKPNAATTKALEENEAYFFAAFDANKGAGPAGVPVAFFETKDGAPQMVSGIDDDVLLNRILMDIKK